MSLVAHPPPDPIEISHIFVDYSNISIGAQANKGYRDKSVRVDPDKLIPLIERDRSNIADRVVVMSPRTPQTVLNKWMEWGYNVLLGSHDQYGREINMDALLQQSIDAVLDLPHHPSIQRQGMFVHKLILLTGDGKQDADDKSFPLLVWKALVQGWRVDMRAWDASIHHIYKDRLHANGGRLSLATLDEHRDVITFSQY